MRSSIQEHEQITRAIAEGQATRARDLLARHVGDAHRRLQADPGEARPVSEPST